ncbi:MAG: sporulation protein YqfD [Clostridiaceae bacterium]|nr:sporulation protein YqfD [Clostridiaceae bacterium]
MLRGERMLLVNLFQLMCGYLVISVEGYFIEKFINICTRRQIYLWDIKKINKCSMRSKISIKGFKAIRPVAYKTKCRVRIVSKKGIPFIINRYRRRKAFFIGVLLFFVLLGYMTSFIWIIEVYGNEELSTEEIMLQLQRCGFKVGVFKPGLDIDRIENEMMLRINRLAWIGIQVKGTKALVEVKERKMPPEVIDKYTPCNIVAAKDGVVESIVVKSGEPMVKKGDTIKKGQLLVSGVMDSKVQGIRYTHAVASIRARTWYEKSREISLIKIKRIKTGEKHVKHTIKFFGKRINLYLSSSIPYENYDKMTYNKEVSIGKEYVLPIVLESNVFEEVRIEKETVPVEVAVSEAVKSLHEDIKKELSEDAEIIDQKSDYIFIDEKNILVKLLIETIEEVGIQEKILKN